MSLLGLLPLVALPLGVVTVRSAGSSWSTAFIGGVTGWGAVCAVVIEALGAAHELSRGPLLAVWVLIDLALVAAVLVRRKSGRRLGRLPRPLTRGEWGLLALVVAVSGVELVVSLASPPNAWDSMTYHMPRAMHWLQSHDLAHYPTRIDRQLWMAPWTEYVIAQVHGLAAGDRWDNLVQWTAGLVSAGAVWVLARELGVGRRGCTFAAAATATIPMAVVQATNTNTDLTTAMWVVVFAAAAQRDARSPSTAGALTVGAALGAGLLTKGGVFLFDAPFLVLWLIRRGRALPSPRVLVPVGVTAAAALLLVGPFLVSNYQQWHHPLGPPTFVDATNSTRHDPGAIFSTLVRDSSSMVATPSPRINYHVTSVSRSILHAVGQNPDDTATTFGGGTFLVQFYRDEAYASAPLHLALILLGLGWLLVRRRRWGPLGTHMVAWAATILLFCAMIRWSYWNNRLEIALLALAMPMVGALLARMPRLGAYATMALLGVVAVGWLMIDRARPLVGQRSVLTTARTTSYFDERPELEAPYLAAVDAVVARHPRQVGLVTLYDDWEYPLWALIKDHEPQVRLFDAVPDEWKGYGTMPTPDVIVCTYPSSPACRPPAGWRVALAGPVEVLAPR